MPMKRHLYPKNWKTIALIVKTLADWRCQECDRPCLKPGENWANFVSHLLHKGSTWYDETYESGKEKKGRFILTVAHLDHDPENPAARLKALCPKCHNRHDAQFRVSNAKRTRYQKKHPHQLTLFSPHNEHP